MTAMMMRCGIMIFAAIRWAGMIMVPMGFGADLAIGVRASMHRGGRHSCKNAEGEEPFQDR